MRFFKRIRRRLLVNRKLREYLIYAVGEIVLVVIGILIALAIDTSLQDRAIRAKEQQYLTGLREEFRLSRRKLAELIRVNADSYAGGYRLIAHMSETGPPPTEAEVSELLYRTFASDISFNPNNSLLLEIMNSGGLQDLSNPELRLSLTNWLATLSDIAKQEDELYAQRGKMLDLFQSEALSVRTVFELTTVGESGLELPPATEMRSNLSLLESRQFENGLLMFLLTNRATETEHYVPLLEELDRILIMLDRETDN